VLRYRLIQARTREEPVREEERASFAARLDVPLDAIQPCDALAGDLDFASVCDGFDVILVGGSGKFSVTDKTPWMRAFIDTLGEIADRQFPTFASCFGFQGFAVALGAEVHKDPPSAEVGTFEISLTEAGQQDPLFGTLPLRFNAQEGHKDRAMSMPSGVTLLAESARCPFQAMRIGDGLVYATQFHPELTAEDNRHRFSRYLTEYSEAFGTDRAQAMLDEFQPSPHASGLLRRYRSLVEHQARSG
jgi:GMP synthase (glutamine-hydrolysing)